MADDAAHALMAELAGDPGGCLPRDHTLGAAGQWRTGDDATACSYTPAGAQLLELLRDRANRRVVDWSVG